MLFAAVSEIPHRRAAAARRSAGATTTSTASSSAAAGTDTRAEPPLVVDAIPCYNYYDIYPEDAGPVANVLLESEEELRAWRLVGAPVTAEVALRDGGCVVFLHENGAEYLKINNSDDEVYGRAAYVKREETARPMVLTEPTSVYAAACRVGENSSIAPSPSCGCWTDDESNVALPSTCHSDCTSYCSSSRMSRSQYRSGAATHLRLTN